MNITIIIIIIVIIIVIVVIIIIVIIIIINITKVVFVTVLIIIIFTIIVIVVVIIVLLYSYCFARDNKTTQRGRTQKRGEGGPKAGCGRGVFLPQLPWCCLLYTSPSPRDQRGSRMPSSA